MPSQVGALVKSATRSWFDPVATKLPVDQVYRLVHLRIGVVVRGPLTGDAADAQLAEQPLDRAPGRFVA